MDTPNNLIFHLIPCAVFPVALFIPFSLLLTCDDVHTRSVWKVKIPHV